MSFYNILKPGPPHAEIGTVSLEMCKKGVKITEAWRNHRASIVPSGVIRGAVTWSSILCLGIWNDQKG